MISVPFDNVPGDVSRLLGEDGLRLINNIYTTEHWQKDFNEVTMTALKGKHKATKCINITQSPPLHMWQNHSVTHLG
jgi:hypothetical protein